MHLVCSRHESHSFARPTDKYALRCPDNRAHLCQNKYEGIVIVIIIRRGRWACRESEHTRVCELRETKSENRRFYWELIFEANTIFLFNPQYMHSNCSVMSFGGCDLHQNTIINWKYDMFVVIARASSYLRLIDVELPLARVIDTGTLINCRRYLEYKCIEEYRKFRMMADCVQCIFISYF